MTRDDITALAGKVSALEQVFSITGNPLEHPLRGLTVKEESLSASEKLRDALSAVAAALPDAAKALGKFEELTHRDQGLTFADFAEALSSISTWESAEEAKRKLLTAWAPEALDLQPLALKQEWEDAKGSFILLRYFKEGLHQKEQDLQRLAHGGECRQRDRGASLLQPHEA